jgi:putative ABC transport system permease protein
MGASVTNIVNLLSKDFLKLVIISFLVAAPIAWYFMHKWLLGFAYRTSIEYWVFVFAGSAALFIALFTVSFQAVRAAIANPARSLRTE